MSTLIVVRDKVGAVPYWAADETLPMVRARFKRLSGKFPSPRASIIAFTGDNVEEITVDDMGTILVPMGTTKIVLQSYIAE